MLVRIVLKKITGDQGVLVWAVRMLSSLLNYSALEESLSAGCE